MRKIFVFLLALMLLCSSALAFSGSYPSWDGVSPAKNAACGSFGGEMLRLDFDAAPDFSRLESGFAQLCFFAFDKSGGNYLEFYLMLPASVAAGDVLSTGNPACAGASIYLFDTTLTDETIYCADMSFGTPYPNGASFEIRISEAKSDAGSLAMHGTLDAVLCRFDDYLPGSELLTLSGVEFDFTLPLSGAADNPVPDTAPFATAPDNAAAPKFTLPPDYITL